MINIFRSVAQSTTTYASTARPSTRSTALVTSTRSTPNDTLKSVLRQGKLLPTATKSSFREGALSLESSQLQEEVSFSFTRLNKIITISEFLDLDLRKTNSKNKGQIVEILSRRKALVLVSNSG